MRSITPWRSRYSPISRQTPWSDLEDRLDRLFGRPFGSQAEEPMQWMPDIDLQENDDEFTLTGEFPGMSEDDIEVDVEQNTLTIRGEKRSERERGKEGGRWHLIERSYGSFQRSFTLPGSVDPSQVKAEFENGVLTVHLPKRHESLARRISIKGENRNRIEGGSQGGSQGGRQNKSEGGSQGRSKGGTRSRSESGGNGGSEGGNKSRSQKR